MVYLCNSLLFKSLFFISFHALGGTPFVSHNFSSSAAIIVSINENLSSSDMCGLSYNVIYSLNLSASAISHSQSYPPPVSGGFNILSSFWSDLPLANRQYLLGIILIFNVMVGPPVARRPPHRSGRAELPHPAPQSNYSPVQPRP